MIKITKSTNQYSYIPIILIILCIPRVIGAISISFAIAALIIGIKQLISAR